MVRIRQIQHCGSIAPPLLLCLGGPDASPSNPTAARRPSSERSQRTREYTFLCLMIQVKPFLTLNSEVSSASSPIWWHPSGPQPTKAWPASKRPRICDGFGAKTTVSPSPAAPVGGPWRLTYRRIQTPDSLHRAVFQQCHLSSACPGTICIEIQSISVPLSGKNPGGFCVRT